MLLTSFHVIFFHLFDFINLHFKKYLIFYSKNIINYNFLSTSTCVYHYIKNVLLIPDSFSRYYNK
jgi:hypothetical protein